MNKHELLLILRQNTDSKGFAQYTYSKELSVKSTELKVLAELESEGYIHKVTSTLGYAIYKIL